MNLDLDVHTDARERELLELCILNDDAELTRVEPNGNFVFAILKVWDDFETGSELDLAVGVFSLVEGTVDLEGPLFVGLHLYLDGNVEPLERHVLELGLLDLQTELATIEGGFDLVLLVDKRRNQLERSVDIEAGWRVLAFQSALELEGAFSTLDVLDLGVCLDVELEELELGLFDLDLDLALGECGFDVALFVDKRGHQVELSVDV